LFEDPQQRLISATVGGLRVVCAYFPNGQSVGSEKFDYKLRWIDALIEWLKPGIRGTAHSSQGESAGTDATPLALLGDFNIAPEDRDAHDTEKWAGQIHCSDE